MQITLIMIIVIFWVCALLASINIYKIFLKINAKKEVENNDILKALPFLAITLSIVIYMFSIEFQLGILAIFICVISYLVVYLIKDGKAYFIAVPTTMLGIFATVVLLFIPCIKAEKTDISKETILLNDYTKSSEKVVIIELGNDPKSYAIMEYDSKIDLPFTLSNIESYEIFESKNKKEKIVVINKDVRKDSLSSCFNLSEPEIEHSTSYKVYLNKENVKYN